MNTLWTANGSETSTATWVSDATGKRVCTMRSCEQDWVNAKLIAQAPAMLRELKRWYDFAQANQYTDQSFHDADGQGWMTSTANVIAKAEGR